MGDTYIPILTKQVSFEPAFSFPPGTVRREKPRIKHRPTKDKPWWEIHYQFTVLAGQSMLTQVEDDE